MESIEVLREPKPPKRKAPTHLCYFWNLRTLNLDAIGMIVRCSCGKRWKCRGSYLDDDQAVWVRRYLPWPQKVIRKAKY